MNMIKNGCIASVWLVLGLNSAMAGIALDSTRIVITDTGGKGGAQIGVTSDNRSKTPYLVKVQISRDLAGDHNDAPFVTSPSLFRLDPDNTQPVLILNKQTNLPQDKESVFYFNALAIPNSDPLNPTSTPVVDGSIQVASSIVVKLFYRPAKLPMTQKDAMGKLQFTATSNGLAISNPTPYYITLNSLTVNGSAIKLNTKENRQKSMIAPFEQQTFSSAPHQGAVEWKAIDDMGNAEVFHGSVQ